MQEKIVMSGCSQDCGGRCPLKFHVRDGIIVRVEGDDGEEPQLRACVRGRAYRQKIYAPERLLYPMKSVGVRGEGKFERISWDEALEKVSAELIRIRDTYGPEAILYVGYPGHGNVIFHHERIVSRLLGGSLLQQHCLSPGGEGLRGGRT